MTVPTLPRRRWFNNRKKAIVAVLLIVGVWLAVQEKWIHDRQVALEKTTAHSGNTGKWTTVQKPGPTPDVIERRTSPVQAEAPWSLRVLGEPGVGSINPGKMSDEEIAELKRLFPEVEKIGDFQLPAEIIVHPDAKPPAAPAQPPSK